MKHDVRQLFEAAIERHTQAPDLDLKSSMYGGLRPYTSVTSEHEPEAAFKAEVQALRVAPYPTDACLRPHQVQIFARGGELTASAKGHVQVCPHCAGLVAGLTINGDRQEDFVRHIRQRFATQGGRNNRPKQVPNAHRKTPLEALDSQHFDVVVTALKDVAMALKGEKGRRKLFREALKYAQGYLAGNAEWELHLLVASDDLELTGWAVECLPRLYFELSTDGGNALVWHYVFACIPKVYRCTVLSELCDGIVFEVAMPPQTAEFVRRLACIFEESRNGNPFPTNQSMRTVALEAMDACSAKATGTERDAIVAAKKDIIYSDALVPKYDEIINALELLASTRRSDHRVELDEVLRPIFSLLPDENVRSLAEIAELKGKTLLASELRVGS